MIDDIWSFLRDESNRALLGWLGAGLVAIVGGIWTALKFLFPKDATKPERVPMISASYGSIVAGRDIRDNEINQRRE